MISASTVAAKVSIDSWVSESFTNTFSQSSNALERLTRSNLPHVDVLRNHGARLRRNCEGVQSG